MIGASLHPMVRELEETGEPGAAVGELRCDGDLDRAAVAMLRAIPVETGGAPLTVRVRPAEDLPAGGYALSYEPGARLLTITAGAPEAQHSAAVTVHRLVEAAATWAHLPGFTVRDWPAVAVRGFMESYYGTVWTPQRRRFMIDLAARHRLNAYAYGPAGDERTGTGWRTPYTKAELAELAEFVRYAADRHVRLLYRISPCAPLAPGQGIRFSDDAEVQLLVDRFRQVGEAGVRTATIAYDDIRGVLADPADRDRFGGDPDPLAAAQADLANRVAAALPGWQVLVCPTQYWGTQPSAYRRRLGELLDPAIGLWWTGPSIVSHRIGAADARQAADAYGRRVWLWDNFPVNDFDPQRLHLGAYAGRAADAVAEVDAVLLNCGPTPEADALTVAALAAYTWDPQRWEPQPARRAAAAQLAGPAAATLLEFADLNAASPLDPRHEPGLAAAVWRYLTELDTAGPQRAAAATGLQTRLAAAAAVADRVAQEPELAWLAEAVAPWLAALRREAALGRAAVAFLELWLNGEPGTSDELYAHGRALRDEFAALEPEQPRVLWDLVRPLTARARPAAAVSGLPYSLVDKVELLESTPN